MMKSTGQLIKDFIDARSEAAMACVAEEQARDALRTTLGADVHRRLDWSFVRSTWRRLEEVGPRTLVLIQDEHGKTSHSYTQRQGADQRVCGRWELVQSHGSAVYVMDLALKLPDEPLSAAAKTFLDSTEEILQRLRSAGAPLDPKSLLELKRAMKEKEQEVADLFKNLLGMDLPGELNVSYLDQPWSTSEGHLVLDASANLRLRLTTFEQQVGGFVFLGVQCGQVIALRAGRRFQNR